MTYTCTPEAKAWFDYAVKCTPILISLVVAMIGWRQWRLSTEKLRSDMYEKRFSVYENTLHFYYALMWADDKTPVAELISVQVKFLTSWRESAFLFEKDVGVYETLDAFRKDTNPLMDRRKGHRESVDSDPTKLEAHLLELETKLRPYLDLTRWGVSNR